MKPVENCSGKHAGSSICSAGSCSLKNFNTNTTLQSATASSFLKSFSRYAVFIALACVPMLVSCTSIGDQLSNDANLLAVAANQEKADKTDKADNADKVPDIPATEKPDSDQPVAEKPERTAIFSTKAKAPDPSSDNTQNESDKPKRTALFSSKRVQQDEQQDDKSNSNESLQKLTAPADSAQANKALKADKENQAELADKAQSQEKGTLLRLFSTEQKKPEKNKQTAAVIKPKKLDTRQYSDALPGVRPNAGIEIKFRTSIYDDTDIDANEDDVVPTVQLASIGSLGRSLPNGLRVARKDIQVNCLKPQLIAMLKQVERRFGKPVIITSGYRSPSHNKLVNGARRSLHMSCAAADIAVPGINKWEVAKFVRAMPGRGGVGTYCHQSIHVDVGPRRDWNWSCSARKK